MSNPYFTSENEMEIIQQISSVKNHKLTSCGWYNNKLWLFGKFDGGNDDVEYIDTIQRNTSKKIYG